MKKNKHIAIEQYLSQPVIDVPSESLSMLSDARCRARDMLFLLFFVFALFLLVALASYHNSDPGWSHTSTVHDVRHSVANLEGRAGAWVSDTFLYLYGYVAYVFPLMIVYMMSRILFRDTREADYEHDWHARVLGFLLILLSVSGMTSLLFVHWGEHYLPATAGGIVGACIAWNMRIIFNVFGSILLLSTFLLIGCSLFFQCSWFEVLQRTYKFFINRIQNIRLPEISHAVSEYAKCFLRKPFSWGWSAFLRRHSDTAVAGDLAVVDTIDDDASTPAGKSLVHRLKHAIPARLQAGTAGTVEIPPPSSTVNALTPVSDTTGFALPRSRKLGKLSLNLLDKTPTAKKDTQSDKVALEKRSEEVEARLAEFNVHSKVVAVHPGPVVTRFELELAAGTKASKVTALCRDLARSLSVSSVRVVEVIPGKSVIGIELPNAHRETVRLYDILASRLYQRAHAPLTLALGKTIAGNPFVADIAKMPHLLVAGTTGAGKSVSLNAMLLSLLYKTSPETLRLILIDPKMLELSVYEGIPHLLAPVVTDMKEAASALRWCVGEMDRRYQLMSALGVRNLQSYNKKIQSAIDAKEPLLDPLWDPGVQLQPGLLETLPYIVVLVDELADMMLVVGKKVEELITRIAQKARAAGIHLILATQRPSVDVITGLIKANIPTRVAFQVSSKIDSRTILDQQGAEQLLGYGDMLYLSPGEGLPLRLHGAFVSDDEVHQVVNALKAMGTPEYVDAITTTEESEGNGGSGGAVMGMSGEAVGEQDALYDQAVAMVTETRRASISQIQRRFKIGYNRAARMVETMEALGVVTAMQPNGSREVVAPPPPPVEG